MYPPNPSYRLDVAHAVRNHDIRRAQASALAREARETRKAAQPEPHSSRSWSWHAVLQHMLQRRAAHP